MASKDIATHAHELQPSSQPPLQPTYVLRGHAAQVQSVQFLRDNSRLLTGDGDGWMVLWGVAQRRAVAVWEAHQGSILGSNVWGANRIITHGRDSSLKVWQLRDEDEQRLSNVLPIDDPSANRQKPWLQHSLAVNTLNFCPFSMCRETIVSGDNPPDDQANDADPALIAVPGVNDKEINVFQLPTEHCVCVVPVIPKTDTGMSMALSLVNTSSSLLLLAGYESGHAIVHRLTREGMHYLSTPIYISHPHKQPILSISQSLVHRTFYTSAADPYLTSHPLPDHASFDDPKTTASTSRPSSLMKNAQVSDPPPISPPLKSLNTGHSGAQSLSVRSDSRILATAGWDSRVRIYSTKTLKELAVLKWHKQGCYATSFADIINPRPSNNEIRTLRNKPAHPETQSQIVQQHPDSDSRAFVALVQKDVPGVSGPKAGGGTQGMSRIHQAREEKARSTHWVAAGSKDGNVSLWEVY